MRGAVSRMMQQRELDLTVASLDVTLSKHIGIGDTWRLDPFAGWNLLMIVPRSEVIDPTMAVSTTTRLQRPERRRPAHPLALRRLRLLTSPAPARLS